MASAVARHAVASCWSADAVGSLDGELDEQGDAVVAA